MAERDANTDDIIILNDILNLINDIDNDIIINEELNNTKITSMVVILQQILPTYKELLGSYIANSKIDIPRIIEMIDTFNLFKRFIINTKTNFDISILEEIITKLSLIKDNKSGGSIKLVNTKIYINVIYNNKKYKRIIYINKNKKKFVKINNQLLELSKLKKV